MSPVRTVFHLADLHVPVEAARKAEYRSVFQRFVDVVRQHPSVAAGEALLVIAGDVFHSKCRAGADCTVELFEWLNQMLDMLPVVVICGNHDFKQEDPDSGDSIRMMIAPYSNAKRRFDIHYLQHTGTYAIQNIGFGVVSVKDTLRKFNTSGVVDTLPPFPDPSSFSDVDIRIALFHGTVTSSRSQAFPSYPLEWFAGYDIAMLGDNHVQQIHHTPGGGMAWGYPGSMIQQNFGEPLYGHGYILWDIPSRRGVCHHIPNDYGRITLKHACGDWLVYLDHDSHGAPLDTASVDPRFPARPHVRVVGDTQSALSALHLAGLGCSGCSQTMAVPSSPHSALPAVHTRPDFRAISDLNHPDTWIEYLRNQGCSGCNIISNPDLLLLPNLLPSEDIDAIQSQLLAFNASLAQPEFQQHRITLGTLRWSFLLCYGADNVLDFKAFKNNIVLLNGPNACGKSSFLDVLCLAIYGEPTPSRRDISGSLAKGNVIHEKKPGDKASSVSLEFFVDGKRYHIVRKFTHRSQTSRSAMASVSDDSGSVAEGLSAVKSWMSARFGSSSNMLVSSILQQLDNTGFFMKKPPERKELIERVLNMHSVNEFASLLRKAVSAWKKVSDKLATRLTERLDAASKESRVKLEEVDALNCEIDRLAQLERRHRAASDDMLQRVTNVSRAAEFQSLSLPDIDAESRRVTAMFLQYRDVADDIPSEAAVREKIARHRGELGKEEEEGDAGKERGDVSEPRDPHALLLKLAALQSHKPPAPLTSKDAALLAVDEHRKWLTSFPPAVLDDLTRQSLHTEASAQLSMCEASLKPALESVSFLSGFVAPDVCDSVVELSSHEVPQFTADVNKLYTDFLQLEADVPNIGEPKRTLQDVDRLLEEKDAQLSELSRSLAAHSLDRRSLEADMEAIRGDIQTSNHSIMEHIPEPPMPKPSLPFPPCDSPQLARSLKSEIDSAQTELARTVYRRDIRQLPSWEIRLAQWNALEEQISSIQTHAELQAQTQSALEERRVCSLRAELASELEALVALDLNPACAACSKQPKFRRMQSLRRTLTSLPSSPDTLEQLDARLAALRADADLRSEHDAKRELMRDEIDAWSETIDKHAASRRLKSDLAVAWWRVWEFQRQEVQQHDRLLRHYSMLSSSLSALNAAQLLRREKRDLQLRSDLDRVRGALRSHASRWQASIAALHRSIRDSRQQLDFIARFQTQRDHQSAACRQARQAIDAWDALAAWEDAVARLERDLGAARRLDTIRIVSALEQRLERIRIAKDLQSTLENLENAALFKQYTGNKEKAEDAARQLGDATRQLDALTARYGKQCDADASVQSLQRELRAASDWHRTVAELHRVFVGDNDTLGFKSWMYENKLVPLLQDEVNRFVAPLASFQLSISVSRGDDMVFRLLQNGCRPLLDHASGYEKFIIGLGMRVALARIGASGQNLKHLFLDEGFTACDQHNLAKTKDIIDNLRMYGNYDSVLLISHMEAIRDVVDARVDIHTDGRGFSLIQHQ